MDGGNLDDGIGHLAHRYDAPGLGQTVGAFTAQRHRRALLRRRRPGWQFHPHHIIPPARRHPALSHGAVIILIARREAGSPGQAVRRLFKRIRPGGGKHPVAKTPFIAA